MLTHPLPQTPFHQLARTPSNRWWKTILGFVFVLIGYVAIIAVGAVVYFVALAATGRKEAPDVGPVAELVLTLGAIILVLPLVFLAARWTQGRPIGTLSSVAGRLRWRWMLTCALLAVAAAVVSLGLAVGLFALTGNAAGSEPFEWVGWSTFLPAIVVVVLLVPLQAAAEEYFCRGWLLQSVGAFVRSPWVAVGVQALVFALLHGVGTPWGFADLMVFAVMAGWLAVSTGGLEAGIALHAVNNVLAFGLTATTVGGLTSDETAADAGWELAVADIIAVVCFGLVVRWLARRRQLQTVVEGPTDLVETPVLAPVN
jgi:uncharacterized protein